MKKLSFLFLLISFPYFNNAANIDLEPDNPPPALENDGLNHFHCQHQAVSKHTRGCTYYADLRRTPKTVHMLLTGQFVPSHLENEKFYICSQSANAPFNPIEIQAQHTILCNGTQQFLYIQNTNTHFQIIRLEPPITEDEHHSQPDPQD